MNIVEHKFNINLERRVTQSDIQITQGNHLLDKLIMNLLYQNEPVTIAGYDTVSISFLRPDGTKTTPLQNAVVENNTVSQILDDTVLAIAGWIEGELTIKESGKTITSARFEFFCSKSIGNEPYESDPRYQDLQNAIHTAAKKATAAAASATAAKGSQDAAALSAQAADAKATAAINSANNAERASNSAGMAASSAFNNANAAKASADKAKASETNAASSASTAQTIADNLQGTVTAAENATTRANTAAERAEHASQTVQPDATKTRKGIVQIGEGINVTGGVISVSTPDLSSKADKAHKHSTSDINGLDAALAEAGKVKSVNGQTGTVTIAAVPSGGTAGQVLKKTPTGFDWDDDNDTQPDLTPYAKTADLDKKVDKVNGKGLSTNDFTDAAKQKVDAIPSDPKYTDTTYKLADGQNAGISLNNYTSAEKTKLAGVEENANKYTLPTASDSILGGIKVGANLSIAADGTINATDTTYNPATPTSPGLMSAADKVAVNSIGSASEAPDVTDKSSVWAAINEAASKGGGGLKITVSTEDAPATGEANSIWFKVV